MKKSILLVSTISALAVIPALGFAKAKVGQVEAKPSIAQPSQEKININTANVEAFQMVKGLGEKKAQAIITYRDNNGSFKSVEDLENVSGIGEKLVSKLKNQLTVG